MSYSSTFDKNKIDCMGFNNTFDKDKTDCIVLSQIENDCTGVTVFRLRTEEAQCRLGAQGGHPDLCSSSLIYLSQTNQLLE